MIPPADVMRRYNLRDPKFVTETGIAHVWQVRMDNGDLAALKIYKDDDPKGEDIGFRLIQSLDGAGVVKVYHFAHSVAVMEWLGGPSLGELSRGGDDDRANAILIEVADALHQRPKHIDLPSLADQFTPLFERKVSGNLFRAQEIARSLIDNQFEIKALHGDLHHDNIKDSARGYLAYDAKGVIGDRAYELANAFQNPLGAEALVHDPARARRMADTWAQHWNTSPKRLLSWVVAHCALSITWGSDGDEQAHLDLLDMLYGVLDGC